MSESPTRPADASNRRKEKRYKTNIDHKLSCRVSIDEPGQDRVWDGTTVDISQSGLRLLTDGTFQAGQAIWIELNSNRSHGVYRGAVRRIEPWVGGQWILGCSLRDTIPSEVLQELAGDGIINRRSDGRFSLSQRATISWPLQADEVVVELQDYSTGGMKLLSPEPIPGTARLRVQFNAGGQEVIVEAKSIWSRVVDNGWVTGLAFTDRDAPAIIAERLGAESNTTSKAIQGATKGSARRALTLAFCFALLGYVLYSAF